VNIRKVVVLMGSALLLAACGGGGTSSNGPEPEIVSTAWTLDALAGEGSGTPVNFTVSGTLSYEDRTYGESTSSSTGYGFTGTTLKPIRHAIVEVLDSSGSVLATTASGDAGQYAVHASGQGDMLLRVRAQSRSPDVTVRDLGNRILAVTKPFTVREGTITLDAEVPYLLGGADFIGGAFNLLDVFSAGAEFVKSQSGRLPDPLTAFWQPGTGISTTGFCTPSASGCPNGAGIYVLGGVPGAAAGDHDEYDDDVLWHEYGHFLEYQFGNLDSLGNGHQLGDSRQDLRLAWSEGWSNYFSGAVKDWLRTEGSGVPSADPALAEGFYIDTLNDDAQIAVDFSAGSLGTPQYYASNESAVAKVLWNLHDALGTGAVWSRFANALPKRQFPANLESYWNAWMRATGNDAATVLPYFRERRVNYAPDTAENSESQAAPTVLGLSTATADNSVARNFYLAPGTTDDADYFAFNGTANTTYRVETFQLVNGTDTQIAVTAPSGAVVAQSDNEGTESVDYAAASEKSTLNLHGFCQPQAGAPDQWVRSELASGASFTAVESGRFLVTVKHPAQVPRAAGYYGGYRVRVSQTAVPLDYPCP
jgi:hypothetical protein